MGEDEKTKPKCKLVGADGNIFNIMALACRELRNSGQGEKTKDLINDVTNSKSYDEALRKISDYVDIY